MKKYFILLAIFLNISVQLWGQLSGKVIDQAGEPLPFVTVYSMETSQATVTNEEGIYNLQLKPGDHTIIFKLLGYEEERSQLTYNNKPIIENKTLVAESYEITEIVISAGGEDPAYPIIRKAIQNRKKYYLELNNYKASVYAKGVMKIMEAPEKIFGQELGDLGGMIDTTTRDGILYLSESNATFYHRKPDDFKEVIHKSIVSGEQNGITFNQYSAANIDLYEERPVFIKELVSPIADDAFTYYRYRLIRSFIDDNARQVFEIQLLPKNESRPCFGGRLFILSDSYRIYGAALQLTKTAIDNPVFDSIAIVQNFAPNQDNKWLLLTQNLNFGLSFFTIKIGGYFTYVISDYQYPISDEESRFGKELIKIEKDADTQDSQYWSTVRPIPLSQEERLDYHKKDSLQIVWKSKEYLDSIDRVNNEFKLINVIQGYTYNQSFKKRAFGFNSLLTTLLFNPVEGYNVTLTPFYQRLDSLDRSVFSWNNYITYGFADERIKWYSRLNFKYGESKKSTLYLRGGREYTTYNAQWQMGTIANSYLALMFKGNHAKIYQRDFGEIGVNQRYENGLRLDLSLSYAHRQSLSNSTNYSIIYKDRTYVANEVFEQPFNNKLLMFSGSLAYTPGMEYMTTNKGRINLGSKYPTIYASVEVAAPWLGAEQDFSKVEIGVLDSYINTGKLGYMEARLVGSMFLNERVVSIPDLIHYHGGEVYFKWEGFYNNTFHILPFYRYSSTASNVRFHFQHHFDGLIMGMIPGVRKLGLKMVLGFNSLQRQDLQHYEYNIGLEGFRLKLFPLGRVDYVRAYTVGLGYSHTVRCGFSDIFRGKRRE